MDPTSFIEIVAVFALKSICFKIYVTYSSELTLKTSFERKDLDEN